MTNTPEYVAYEGAKSRCTKVKYSQWKDYGGRGIEFRFTSFEQFFAEVGLRPVGMTLDRINNNGHYEPGNVRWATRFTQIHNRRISKEIRMNNATFAGCVGQDATIRYTGGGQAVASFSLAIKNGKDKDGEERAATWITATLWGKKAEGLAQYIKKGIYVAVSGPVKADAWTDKNSGEARAKINVNVFNFTFLGGGQRRDNPDAPAPDNSEPQGPEVTDEDIPF